MLHTYIISSPFLIHLSGISLLSTGPRGISLLSTGPLTQSSASISQSSSACRPNTYTLEFFSNPFSYFNIFSVMDQIGSAVAADAINKLVALLIQQIDDVIHLDQNRGLLQAKLNRMKLLLQDICNGFQNQQRTPPESIRDYLESTRAAIGEAKSIIDRSQLHQRCLDCIFCKPRISRQIREWNTGFDQLLQELRTLFSIFANAHLIGSSSAQPRAKELLQPLPEWGVTGLDIKSAEKQLQTLINAEAPQFRMIGVYGMAGVGKTTLLRSVHNFYKVSDVFDVVIWVTVSQDYKIRHLQGCVAKALNLDISPDLDIETLKMTLSATLLKKKFLLILDDIWSPLDLQQELGVQFGDDKASKVVFSTRNKDLALTEAKVSIKVEPLSRDEGWELFQRVAFRGGPVPEDLKECARQIADECEGLPLAITVVAATMRGKRTAVDEWKYCWSLLKNADLAFPDTYPRVDKELYQKLRWSYDDLSKTPHLQYCFLYCAMYPEDAEIPVEELVLMWTAEGFFKGKEVTDSMEAAYRYVQILIDRGLFQNGNFEKQSMDIVNKPANVWRRRYITVHDVIRDMALFIGERGENYLCRSGQQLRDFPHIQSQADCKRISVSDNEIQDLPKDFQCPKLVSLLLSGNPLGNKGVSENFLINLSSLRILDLSSTRIKAVPTSLTKLALLEFLNLSYTSIKELPEDIGNLAQLRYLNLSFCNELVSLPSSIGKLTQLQDMNLGCCSRLVLPTEISQITSLRRLDSPIDPWIGLNNGSSIMGTWSEIQNLSLSFSRIELNNGYSIMGRTWSEMGTWPEMQNLSLSYSGIHDPPQEMPSMKKLQSVRLWDCSWANISNSICAFQQLQRVDLFNCNRADKLSSLETLPNLKFLKLKDCGRVTDLMIGRSGNPCVYPMLEMLVLDEMDGLQSLAWPLSTEGGVLEEGTLPKLRVLKIKYCVRLRKLPIGMEKLPNLRALYGSQRWWENIIWKDNTMKICLHKLFKTKKKYNDDDK